MSERTDRRSGRAVSDVLGFVLLFSLVTLTVTSVFVLGTLHLDHAREAEQLRDAERAVGNLAAAIDDHLTQRATVRSTELRMTGSALSFGAEETMQIEVEAAGTGETDPVRFDASPSPVSPESSPIEYTTESGSTVVYSHGAVFREEPGDSRMIREPTAQFGPDRVVFPLLVTSGDGHTADSNARATRVRTERAVPETVFEAEAVDELRITVRTTESRAEAWRRYFEGTNVLDCSVIGRGDVTCTASTVETVAVTVMAVQTSLE